MNSAALSFLILFFLFGTTCLNAQNKNLTVYNAENSPIAGFGLMEMDIDLEGNVWCVYDSTLIERTVGGAWRVFTTADFDGASDVLGVVVLKDQSIFVSSRSFGFFRHDGVAWTPLGKHYATHPRRLRCDTLGNVWYVLSKQLYRWNGTTAVEIESPPNCDDVFITHENVVWAVAYDRQYTDTLYQFTGTEWRRWYDSTGVVQRIHGMTEWRGGLWCATEAGFISHITNDTAHWSVLDPAATYNEGVISIAPGPDGRLWIAQFQWSILYYDGNTTSWMVERPNDHFTSMKYDRFGNMWMAGHYGLYVYHKGGVVAIPPLETSVTSELDVYPTVATAAVTARTSGATGAQRLLLVNALGQVLDSRPVSSDETLQFPTAQLPAGVYFLQLHTSNRIITRRFITH